MKRYILGFDQKAVMNFRKVITDTRGRNRTFTLGVTDLLVLSAIADFIRRNPSAAIEVGGKSYYRVADMLVAEFPIVGSLQTVYNKLGDFCLAGLMEKTTAYVGKGRESYFRLGGSFEELTSSKGTMVPYAKSTIVPYAKSTIVPYSKNTLVPYSKGTMVPYAKSTIVPKDPDTSNKNITGSTSNNQIISRKKEITQERKYTKKEADKEKPQEKKFPFIEDDSMRAVFERFIAYRARIRKSYKCEDSLKAAYKKLEKLSGGDVKLASEIVEQTLANGWQGLFALKSDNNNGRATNKPIDRLHINNIFDESETDLDWL